MEDTELYAMLFGIKFPWRVSKVKVDMESSGIDVWVNEAPGIKLPCVICNQETLVYDHTEEQIWRNLDTCQCQTFVHARLPRTTCSVDGVKQLKAPWAESRSHFTRLFESRLLDSLKECDVTGVTRLSGTTLDETWSVLIRAVTRGLARK